MPAVAKLLLVRLQNAQPNPTRHHAVDWAGSELGPSLYLACSLVRFRRQMTRPSQWVPCWAMVATLIGPWFPLPNLTFQAYLTTYYRSSHATASSLCSQWSPSHLRPVRRYIRYGPAFRELLWFRQIDDRPCHADRYRLFELRGLKTS